ncbi:MAG: hypothetical protein JJU28_17135 [Cyclobacteriaceae bacterium]|nr:hypothetical protein [Cyclobacteriaceae bacterium]
MLTPWACFDALSLPKQDLLCETFSYHQLTPYQKSLFEGFVQSSISDGQDLDEILTPVKSIRSTIRLASALMFRNNKDDFQNAINIIEWILAHQYTDITDQYTYGTWKTSVNSEKIDLNWREFIACELIIIYKTYYDLLPQSLQQSISAAIIRAAEGSMVRDVAAEYTNISVMSAFLMHFAGDEFDKADLSASGILKAKRILELYERHHAFSEYNSPTYDGVSLIGFALWRKFGTDPLRTMGIHLEQALWTQISLNYNPQLKNMVGPHIRSYGMDMTKYVAITGIWIALVTKNAEMAPLPLIEGAKYFEMSNIATIFHLGLCIPKSLVNRFNTANTREFTENQVINPYFDGDTLKTTTSIIQKEWMMGAMWGNRRIWSQIYSGTIHWKNNDNEIEWLLVPGDGKTNVIVSENCMKIYNGQPGNLRLRGNNFSVYVYSTKAEEINFKSDTWNLGLMQLHFNIIQPYSIEEITDPEILSRECAISESYAKVMKITFEVPKNFNIRMPLLEIKPVYVN